MNTPPPTVSAIMAEIRAEMARQGLTASDLADRMNVPHSTLRHQIRSGAMSLTQVVRVAEALRIPLADLTHRAVIAETGVAA